MATLHLLGNFSKYKFISAGKDLIYCFTNINLFLGGLMLNNKVEICGVNTAKIPVLKSDEKKALFEKILEGDEEARSEYIFGNLRLVLSIIQRFNNRGEYVDDIFQVGCIGLIKAIDNFDVTQGVQFSTYAVPIYVIRRKHSKEDVHMTRKQALHKALEVIMDEATKEKIAEILSDMPFTGWSEGTIFDTIDQFIIDHGRVPTTTDFKKKGLPPHPVIKLRFGKTLREFLETHYPTPKLCNSKIYGSKSREEWQEIFISEYHKVKPGSAEEYNSRRSSGLPSWATIAKQFGITKWLDWLLFCEIVPYIRKNAPPRGRAHPKPLKVISVMAIKKDDGSYFHITRDDDNVLWYCDADRNFIEPFYDDTIEERVAALKKEFAEKEKYWDAKMEEIMTRIRLKKTQENKERAMEAQINRVM